MKLRNMTLFTQTRLVITKCLSSSDNYHIVMIFFPLHTVHEREHSLYYSEYVDNPQGRQRLSGIFTLISNDLFCLQSLELLRCLARCQDLAI